MYYSKVNPLKLTNCSLVGSHLSENDYCINDDLAKQLGNIDDIAKQAGCPEGDGKCVLQKVRATSNDAGIRSQIDEMLVNNFKTRGPTDTSLLNDRNISGVLKQFEHIFPDFFAYNFNMINYATHSLRNGYVIEQPDTLATIKFGDLYARGIRKAACVINSDFYHGRGKHWMALFIDADKGTVEFFNSSGKGPAPEWENWLQKTATQMQTVLRRNVEIVRLNKIVQQRTKTECGVYSLFYIWYRLLDGNPRLLLKQAIKDEEMFRFRQHLFSGNEYAGGATFDVDDYKSKIKILWA